ncbi:DUF4054 domain-containing protein [Gracilibacillus oryzae]|uniref:DUF4054 domain-containing protein n=1 Tax=Gracilibacillus oryzae TaxID=1672701 RepID=A0A7C8GVM8_9BACI|nr:DUF4054 domain-containing protein [Gracilibacillus oryzae]KAB8139270.1 DUF4054 domain-containing protein [Gracilibacillus oryzae]
MPLTDKVRVRAIAHHLKRMADEDLDVVIEDAEAEVAKLSVKSEDRERLVRYLAAHMATLNYRRATSQSLTDMSESYNAPQGDGLSSTEYGQEYMRLEKKALGPGGLGLVVI